MDGETGADEPEPIDHAEQMAFDPGTRPICAALTADMRRALRTRQGRTAGLQARRLVCPGRGFVPTPMGAQWREDMIRIERMERALRSARDLLRDGAERQDVLDVVMGGLG